MEFSAKIQRFTQTKEMVIPVKISPYLHLDRIEFVTTYQCTGRCIHCSLGGRLNAPGGAAQVEPKAAAEFIQKAAEYFPITSVMCFGGEPLLYPDTVCAVYEAARACGVAGRQLITNGYFTKDEEYRRQTAQALKESGLNDCLLSVDAFHQASIPFEPVYRFAENAKLAGIPVRLQPAWVVNESHKNEYNDRTREVLKRFEPLHIPVSSGNDIFMAGNAALYLTEYYPQPKLDLAQTCGSMPYTDPLTEIRSLSVEPNGDVTVCGFTIGNIYREKAEAIFGRYDPYENSLMRAILTRGAPGLVKEAEKAGLSTAGCYSICDLCHQLSATLNGQKCTAAD